MKEYANDDKTGSVFKSEMAERRKYCEFDEATYDIDWSVNSDDDANVTIIKPGNNPNSLEVKCPDGFIVKSIDFVGTGDYTVNPSSWYGVSNAYPFIYPFSGTRTFTSASASCTSIGSSLVSLHNSATEDILEDILPAQSFWIGLNDMANERTYRWTDGTSYNYQNWASGQPDHHSYCCERSCIRIVFEIFCWCSRYGNYGDPRDGVRWNTYGWSVDFTSNGYRHVCFNPDINYNGINQMSSFKNTIDELECIQPNRGPLKHCQTFIFNSMNFGDNINSGYQLFECEGASIYSGYDNNGKNGAWLLNGIIFSDNSGTLNSVIGLSCCLIPGTIYSNTDYNNGEIIPQSPHHIDAYGSTSAVANSGDYSNNFYGIRGIIRGSEESIQGIAFDSISDYIPNGCALDGSLSSNDYTYCMNNRLDNVDYENIVSTPTEGITPNIDTSIFECNEGCNPNITSECEYEYNNDNPQPNPFVAKFECKNINFTYAIMEKYEKCYTYSVFPALFYDYHSELHRELIVSQLDPYINAIGNAVLKLWQTIFIILLIKMFVFPFYFKLEEEIASSCCDAIRLKRVVQVEVAKELTVKQIKKMTQQSSVNVNVNTSIEIDSPSPPLPLPPETPSKSNVYVGKEYTATSRDNYNDASRNISPFSIDENILIIDQCVG